MTMTSILIVSAIVWRSCCLPACWRGVTSIPAGDLAAIRPFLIRRLLPRMLPLKSGETQPEQTTLLLPVHHAASRYPRCTSIS